MLLLLLLLVGIWSVGHLNVNGLTHRSTILLLLLHGLHLLHILHRLRWLVLIVIVLLLCCSSVLLLLIVHVCGLSWRYLSLVVVDIYGPVLIGLVVVVVAHASILHVGGLDVEDVNYG